MSFVWTKQLLAFFKPETIVFLRLVISTVLLLVFSLSIRKLEKVKKEHWLMFGLLSIFQPFLYFIGEGYGVKYTSASMASIMIATIPLFTPIGAAIFLKEKVRWINIAGLLLSFSGVLVIVFSDGFSAIASLKGMLFLLGAVFSAAGYYLLLKRVADHYNSFTVATYQNFVGIILFLPLVLWDGGNDLAKFDFSYEILWPLLALSVLASSLAFIFNTSGVRILGPTKSAAFTNVIPVFTVVFAFIILKESISFQQLAGMGVVLSGLILVQQSGKK
jgi:drug/metabolite transporter (DMT)-like permease